MGALFFRSLSEGLQAFVPIACLLAWSRAAARRDQGIGSVWGLVAAVPASLVAGYAFQASVRQAMWEAVLATVMLVPAAWFAAATLRRGDGPPIERGRSSRARLLTAAFAALSVARQAMLIVAVLFAAFAMGSVEAITQVGTGAVAAIALAAAWVFLARWLPRRTVRNATRGCAVVFLVEVAVYAFHKFAEARLLPWSEVLEAATEPYGPDGLYGLYVSYLLIILPLTLALLDLGTSARDHS